MLFDLSNLFSAPLGPELQIIVGGNASSAVANRFGPRTVATVVRVGKTRDITVDDITHS